MMRNDSFIKIGAPAMLPHRRMNHRGISYGLGKYAVMAAIVVIFFIVVLGCGIYM